MSAQISAVQELTTAYSTTQLLGMMTAAMFVALILIALSIRFIRTLSAVKNYETACEKVKAIESKLEEMNVFTSTLELEYEKNFAEMSDMHAKELFELRQVVFERNSEILDLKNKMITINTLVPL